MPLDAIWLPVPTPLDPIEDPPGSLDPLGTLVDAERLSEALLPGFTVRMWRARLLTFVAVAAAVTERLSEAASTAAASRLEARLAFERLFVSSLTRFQAQEATEDQNAIRRVPGRDMAKAALDRGESLTRTNFLKGQAVNGPFGTVARLARQLQIIDDESRPGAEGSGLLLAWAADEALPGILDGDYAAGRGGGDWMESVVRQTMSRLEKKGADPGPHHGIWQQLSKHLRPDGIGLRERQRLLQLLERDGVRQRVLRLLTENVTVYREVEKRGHRGLIERMVLQKGLKPNLGDNPVDSAVAALVGAIDAYEYASGWLQQAFDCLVWGLKQHGGRQLEAKLVADPRLDRELIRVSTGIARVLPRLDAAIHRLHAQPPVASSAEGLQKFRDDVAPAVTSPATLIKVLMNRHERVQEAKRKTPWIERGAAWVLLPGQSSVGIDEMPVWRGDAYLHPFKIQNAYSMLADLGEVSVDAVDGEG